MPLNNTTKNFFETLRKKSKTQIMRPLREMLIEEYRQSSKEFFSELCEMSIPEEITVSILDIPSIDGNIIHTRIYHSEAYSINSRGKNPAVIFFPGGGFILQLPGYYDNPCAKMAKESGCTVIAVYCRVAPEFTHQYGMADAILATKYCFTHAQQLNLDQERFAVAGNSSGGNFAALVTNALRGSDVKISYQLLLSPRVDVSLTCGGTQDYMPYQEQDIMLSREAQEYFTTLYIPRNLDPKDKSISP
ncbi:MAG: alpha/beta hydrolase fold domain-containing protein, partial [Gammaproteobacteria bacterium]